MSINVAEGFEKIEKTSRAFAVASAIGRAASSALSFDPFFGDMFGLFTNLGLLGRATGWGGKKLTERTT